MFSKNFISATSEYSTFDKPIPAPSIWKIAPRLTILEYSSAYSKASLVVPIKSKSGLLKK